MATRYIAKSPFSGYWIRKPGQGVTPNIAEAHVYAGNDPHLVTMAQLALQHGRCLKLRQVEPEAQPTSEGECRWCDGTGQEPARPFYECAHCGGLGSVSE